MLHNGEFEYNIAVQLLKGEEHFFSKRFHTIIFETLRPSSL